MPSDEWVRELVEIQINCLTGIHKRMDTLMTALADIKSQLDMLQSSEQKLEAFAVSTQSSLANLQEQLAAAQQNADDPAELAAISAQITSMQTAVAAALPAASVVTANPTPAAPVSVVDPAPPATPATPASPAPTSTVPAIPAAPGTPVGQTPVATPVVPAPTPLQDGTVPAAPITGPVTTTNDSFSS